jgi:response regulator RpfG family c-di-GMP phosphodiesterase
MFRFPITALALCCFVAFTPIQASPQRTRALQATGLERNLAQDLNEELLKAREDALTTHQELRISLENLIQFLPRMKASNLTNAADFNKAKAQLPKQLTELGALYTNLERATKKPELTQQIKKIVAFLVSLEATGEMLVSAINVETMDATTATEFEEVVTDFSLKLISAEVRAEHLEEIIDES